MFVLVRERLDGTTVQVGFFILAFLGLLFFGDQLGATSTKHIRTKYRPRTAFLYRSERAPLTNESDLTFCPPGRWRIVVTDA
jgi:hypothetical protein